MVKRRPLPGSEVGTGGNPSRWTGVNGLQDLKRWCVVTETERRFVPKAEDVCDGRTSGGKGDDGDGEQGALASRRSSCMLHPDTADRSFPAKSSCWCLKHHGRHDQRSSHHPATDSLDAHHQPIQSELRRSPRRGHRQPFHALDPICIAASPVSRPVPSSRDEEPHMCDIAPSQSPHEPPSGVNLTHCTALEHAVIPPHSAPTRLSPFFPGRGQGRTTSCRVSKRPAQCALQLWSCDGH